MSDITTSNQLNTIIIKAVTDELEKNWKDDSNSMYSDRIKDCMAGIVAENLALLSNDNSIEQDMHRKNIAFYESSLHSLRGVSVIKSYQATINIIGRVLVDILKAGVMAI